jgi:hypothetical protein
MITRKQVSSMILQHQHNDFAPVTYTVCDYRSLRTETTVEPVREGQDITSVTSYYTDHGYTVTVRDSRGEFDYCSQVFELSKVECELHKFGAWWQAEKFVRDNFAGLDSARQAFYREQDARRLAAYQSKHGKVS